MLGMYPLGTRPVGALPRARTGQVLAVLVAAGAATMAAPSIVKANSVLLASGSATLMFDAISTRFSQLLAAGAGDYSPIITALASASATFTGVGGFSPSNSPSGIAQFNGVGQFVAASYAFYADAERACLHQELRTAAVVLEDRTAIVPFEDRVYRVSAEVRNAGDEPRKRIC